MVQTNQQGFPQITSPLVDPGTGSIKQVWLQLLINLWNRTGGATGGQPAPIAPVTVSGSPVIYTASNAGHLWINQGTYCDVAIVRGLTTVNSGKVTRGIFPMSPGDVATVTYTTLTPTIYFV